MELFIGLFVIGLLYSVFGKRQVKRVSVEGTPQEIAEFMRGQKYEALDAVEREMVANKKGGK